MPGPRLLFLACVSLFSLAGTAAAPPATAPAHRPAAAAALAMSPALVELFRTEMRELQSGTQVIAAALPAGDWDGIVKASRQMKQSYVLEKKLTSAQRKELGALPERFRDLDAEFHARSDRLGAAAASHDPELVAFQYSRLLETCTSCHAAFAPARFPGLAARATESHRH